MQQRRRTARISLSVFPEEKEMLLSMAKQVGIPFRRLLQDALNLWLDLHRSDTPKDYARYYPE